MDAFNVGAGAVVLGLFLCALWFVARLRMALHARKGRWATAVGVPCAAQSFRSFSSFRDCATRASPPLRPISE
jgi:hypothetical protein